MAKSVRAIKILMLVDFGKMSPTGRNRRVYIYATGCTIAKPQNHYQEEDFKGCVAAEVAAAVVAVAADSFYSAKHL